MKPRLFIGSSVEGLSIAYAAQQNLHDVAEVTVWDQGVFKLSSTSVESLLQILDTSDFGVFVFSPDDSVSIRGEKNRSVRDNVLFELGLFLGALGRERCFMLVPEGASDLRISSDLLGITPGKYETDRSDGSWQAATGPACHSIREAIMKVGARSEEVQAPTASPKPKEDADKEEAEKETKAQLDSSEERDDLPTWFKAYLNYQYDKAVELLEKQISEGDEEIDRISLQIKVGIIKYKMNPQEGTIYLEDLINKQPQNPSPYLRLANLHIGRGLHSEALDVIARGFAVVKDKTLLVVAKVKCLQELEKHEEVVTTLLRGIEDAPREQLFYQTLADHYINRKDYDAARKCLERGNQEIPDKEELLAAYAKLLLNHFDAKLSLVPFNRLLQLKPEHPEYLSLQGNVLLNLDLNDLAMRNYQLANKLTKEEQGWILGNIGNLYKNRGFYGDGIIYLKKALERDPDSQYAYERLAIAIKLTNEEKEKLSTLLMEARRELVISTKTKV